MIKYLYWDFVSNPIKIDDYKSFLKEYYHNTSSEHFLRFCWYLKRGDFHVLLAMQGDKVVGQACVFKVTAFVHGKEVEWWWGADNFVLPSMQGKGIGKQLQLQLHKDFPNFSSLWYSRVNGFIKRKCGAHNFLLAHFNYYPVASFFSVIIKVLSSRYLHYELPHFNRKSFAYFHLSNVFSRKEHFTASEISLFEHVKQVSELAISQQSKHDFYIPRTVGYLKWKYLDNPSLKDFHTLQFTSADTGDVLGVVIFSGTFIRKTFSVNLTVSTILDLFVQSPFLTEKDVLQAVMAYFFQKKVYLDGILTLLDIPFYPYLRYPFKGVYLLTNSSEEVANHYLSYIDQDLEQM